MRLKAFRLPSFLANYMELARKAEKSGWTHLAYLEALAELEAQDRQDRRVERLMKVRRDLQ
jgi:DNA replication protein DnaC